MLKRVGLQLGFRTDPILIKNKGRCLLISLLAIKQTTHEKRQREITTIPLSTWVHTALLARTRMKKEVGRLGLAYIRERERESAQLFGTTK